MTNLKTLSCPNCGNTNVDEFDLHVQHPCFSIHPLMLAPDGSIHANKEQAGLVHQSQSLGETLLCKSCHTTFPSPGIPLK